jgi:hypothetical protein
MAITNYAVTTSSATAAYTSSGDNAVTVIHICNYSGADATMNIYAVPNGGSVGNSTIIYSGLLVRAGDTYIISSEKLILANGDKIYITGSANSTFTATISSIGV